MVEGDAVALDSDAVTRMATWAAKTVMTRELLDKGMGDLSIPEWQYRWLHDYVSAPQTMLMYFGKAEYAPDKWDRHRRFRAVVDDKHLGGTEGFITSFVIGHFWFIVAGLADEDIFDAFKDSIDEFYTQHHLRSLARFWPPETVDGFVSDPCPAELSAWTGSARGAGCAGQLWAKEPQVASGRAGR